MYKLKIGVLEKALVAIVVAIMFLIIGIITYYAQDNVLTNKATSKEEAVQKAEKMDTTESYTRVVSDFKGNFVKDTAYAITTNDEELYGQGYYVTYIPDNDLVFCLQLYKTATKLVGNVNEEGSHYYSTLDTKTQEQVQRIILSAKDLYNQTQNPEYLVSGQIMLWSLFGELNYTTDIVKDRMDEIKQNESKYEDLSGVKIEYYQTLGQDLIDVIKNVSEKSLNITKVADKEEVKQGEEIKYTITINNDGKEDLQNIVVSDTLDEQKFNTTTLNNIIVSKGETIENKNILTWKVKDLKVGEEETLTYTVKINENLQDASDIFNSAVACADQTECVDDSAQIKSSINPDFEVSKEADTNSIEPGDKITYTIKVVNTGNVQLNNLVVIDELENNLNALTVENVAITTGEVTQEGNKLTWDISLLEVDEEAILTFDVKTNEYMNLKTKTINNEAKACTLDNICKSDNEKVQVTVKPNIEVNKTSDKMIILPGDIIHYNVRVKNTGNIALKNVKVTDPLDDPNLNTSTIANVTVKDNVGNTLTEDVDYTLEPSTNSVYVNKIDISEYVDIEFDINAMNPFATGSGKTTSIVNTVQARSEDESSFEVVEDNDDDQLEVLTPSAKIQKTANTSVVQAGDIITYTIKVMNDGEVDLTDLVVTDKIEDPNLDKSTISNVITTTGTAAIESTGTITWTIDELKIEEEATLTFDVNVKEDIELGTGQISNIASVCNAQINCDDTDTTSNIEIDLDVNPALEIEEAADKTSVVSGETIEYSIKVPNTGNVALTNVEVEDLLSDPNLDESTITGLTIKDQDNNTLTLNADYTVDSANNKVTIDKIKKDGYVVITFDIKAMDPFAVGTNVNTQITNPATVCFDNPKTVMDDCKNANVSIGIDLPSVKLTKEANLIEAQPGDTITYIIKVENNGEVNLTDLVVTDKIKDINLDKSTISNVTTTTGTATTDSSGIITWTIDSLAVTKEATLTFDVQVKDDVDLSEEKIINTANACNAQINCNDSDANASEEIKLNLAPKLSIEKTTDKESVQTGEEINYSIKIFNRGNVTLKDVEVIDLLSDPNLDISTIGGLTLTDQDNNTLTLNTDYTVDSANKKVTIDKIKKDDYVVISFDINAMDPFIVDTDVNTQIMNIAKACFNNPKTIGEDCKEASIDIDTNLPDVKIQKLANTNVVKPGDVITYGIKVENNGEVDLSNLVITDEVTDINLDIATINNITTSLGTSTNVDGLITWTINELDVGEEATLTFDIQVKNDVELSTKKITNTASICNAQINCNTPNTKSTIDVNIYLEPNLTLNKISDKSEVNPGDTIHYELTVKNTGNVGLFNVLIEDSTIKGVLDGTIESNLDPATINSLKVRNSSGTIMSEGTGLDEYTKDLGLAKVSLNHLAKGDYIVISFDIDVVDAPTFSGDTNGDGLDDTILTNEALACFSEEEDCIKDDININLNKPSLDVTKTSSVTSGSPKAIGETIKPGYTIGYTITATNKGNIDLTNVIITDDISTFVDSFETDSINIQDGGTIDSSTSIITWNIPTLAVGQSKEVHFSATISRNLDAGSIILNEACGISNELLLESCGKTENPTDVIKDIALDKEAKSAAVAAGGTEQYILTVTNLSDVDLENVVISDSLDDVGFDKTNIVVDSVVSDLKGQLIEGIDYTVDTSDGLLVQMLTPFEYADILTITFTVGIKDTVANKQVITNIAQACFDNGATCDLGTANVSVGEVNLSVDKTVDKATAEVGTGSLTYEISVTNDSDVDANNVYLSDNIDDEFWDGKVGSAGEGSGNLDNSTLELVSVTDKDMIPITNYTVTEPTDYDTEDYVVYFPTVSAGETYTVTYTIDQAPWLNGPTYNNDYLISIQDRFDDYLITNKVTGYYDEDENSKLTDTEQVGSKLVRTRLAAVYNYNIATYSINHMASIFTYNIGLTPIITENTMERFVGSVPTDNLNTTLFPGQANKSWFSETNDEGNIGYTIIVNKVQYPVSGEYKDFVNYTTSGMIDSTATPVFEGAFGSISTTVKDIKDAAAAEGGMYLYEKDMYGNIVGNELP